MLIGEAVFVILQVERQLVAPLHPIAADRVSRSGHPPLVGAADRVDRNGDVPVAQPKKKSAQMTLEVLKRSR